MTRAEAVSPEFWAELERDVALRVASALGRGGASRAPLIAYLRDIDSVAQAACDDRQTVQIIASARRLLGDRELLGPGDGPFARPR